MDDDQSRVTKRWMRNICYEYVMMRLARNEIEWKLNTASSEEISLPMTCPSNRSGVTISKGQEHNEEGEAEKILDKALTISCYSMLASCKAPNYSVGCRASWTISILRRFSVASPKDNFLDEYENRVHTYSKLHDQPNLSANTKFILKKTEAPCLGQFVCILSLRQPNS